MSKLKIKNIRYARKYRKALLLKKVYFGIFRVVFLNLTVLIKLSNHYVHHLPKDI